MKIKLVPSGKNELRNLIIRWTIPVLVTFVILFRSVSMPLKSFAGKVGNYTADELLISEKLSGHVKYLSDTIGIRTVFRYAGLKSSEDYITSQFESYGYSISKQRFSSEGKKVSNIEVEITGKTSPEKIIIIGAHYDSHFNTPGADDNASGVAALLELANLFKDKKCDKTIRFVAFVNEEPPFFGTEEMGSLQYARRCAAGNEEIETMFSLETMGYYTHEPKSQKYPFIFQLFYPDVGNFISFISNMSSGGAARDALRSFRRNCEFPSIGLTPPGWIKGIGWSDHWSFWKYGYKGVMITNTAPYRNKNYHRKTDTSEKLNYKYMAKVLIGLESVFEDMLKI